MNDHPKILDLSGIYAIVNLVNNKKYIGGTFNFWKRFKRHKSYLYNCKHPNRHLQFAWNKYGESNFRFECILICEKDYVDYYEVALIKLYDTNNPKIGYNLETGGGLGKSASEESRRKNSESKRGNKNHMFGKHHSAETKGKISESLRGQKLSNETKKKISDAIGGEKHYCFGKHLSAETRKKISVANMGHVGGMSGKHHTEESKKKMRESQRLRFMVNHV